MCMAVLAAYMSVFYLGVWGLRIPEEGIRSPGCELLDICELPCGCCKSNLGPLDEQAVLFTTELFLQAQPHPVSCDAGDSAQTLGS